MQFITKMKSALLIAVALFAINANADDFADGKYYIKNVAKAKYLAAGHDWGTRAIVNEAGLDWTMTKVEEGIYTLDSQVSNGGDSHFLGTNGYCDAGAANWTIAKDGDFYTIKGEPGFVTVDGDDNIAFVAEADDAAKWEIISEADLQAAVLAAMANATEENPVEATIFVKDANFNRNDLRKSAWTMNASNQNLSGGNNTNNCAESWQSAFTLSQVVALPNGKYKVTAQATLTDYTDAYDGVDYPVVYANDVTSVFNSMDEDDRGTNMSKLSESFTAGKYQVEPLIANVTDGTLTIGVKGTRTNTWCIWDNFQVFRIGDLPIEIYQEAYQKKIEEALATAGEEMSKSAKAALEAAIEANSNADMASAEALQAATKALNDAIADAQTSITSYAILYGDAEIADNSLNGWTCSNTNTFHINTWSVEGNPGNDPSGMVTPFVENWVGAPGPLGEGDIAYTMAGLEPGTYTATALIRVYSESGNEPAGAKFFLNNDSIDMAQDGINFVYNNMKGMYAQYVVTGTVGEDGVLKFGVNISNPTFNWVAIKNIDVIEGTPAQALEEARELAINLIPFTSDREQQKALAEALNKTATLKTPAECLEGCKELAPIVVDVLEAIGAKDEPEKVVAEGWTKVISNGNFADEENVDNFFVKHGADGAIVPAEVKEGIGMNGSKGVFVKSEDNPANDWDAQFFIQGNQALASGTKVHVEFDYKASVAGDGGTQWHTTPGNYKHWNCVGTANFTTDWKHYNFDATVDAAADGSATIAFNLSINKAATYFYFDNIVFWIQEPEAAAKDATGIETIEATQAGAEIFNLNGQKVAKAQKGLYIKNGKKVILK